MVGNGIEPGRGLIAKKGGAGRTKRLDGRNEGSVTLGESGKRRLSDMKSTITNLITLTMIFAFAFVIRFGMALEMMR